MTETVVGGRVADEVVPHVVRTVPPTLLVLFRKPRYGAGALRDGAPAPAADAALVVTTPELLPREGTPVDVVGALLSAAPAAPAGTPWLAALAALLRCLRRRGTHVAVRALGDDGVLDDLTRVAFPGMPGAVAFGTVDAGDLFHSLVLVGPPGTTLTLWNERACAPGQGAVRVTLGPSGLAEVEDLDLLGRTDRVGDARVEVLAPPAGGYLVSCSMTWPGGLRPQPHRVTGFAGELSSLQLEVVR